MGSRALARSSGWIAMLLRGWTQLQRHTATLCLSLQHPVLGTWGHAWLQGCGDRRQLGCISTPYGIDGTVKGGNDGAWARGRQSTNGG